jgi:predicted GNAT family acetyltransferase
MIEIKEGINKFYLGDTLENPEAEITYVIDKGDTIIIDRTFVSDELRGQNVGKQLIQKVVDLARQENKKIIPQCSFAQKEFTKNKEYEDVLFK